MMRQVGLGTVKFYERREMLDLVVADGKARGVIARNMVDGRLESYEGDAVILATGGYGNVFFLSTNAKMCNATATWRAHKRGAFFGNPCFTQIHPTCIPVASEHQSKLTLMSESLRNDGRIWVPKAKADKRAPNQIPEEERDYYLERLYPSFGTWSRAMSPPGVRKRCATRGTVWGPQGWRYTSIFRRPLNGTARRGSPRNTATCSTCTNRSRGGRLRVTDEDIPRVHYTMGGLWVDYNLMGTIPGLFVLGEANFSDHGANRLGASALMQGLADGYFIIPYTIGDYLASNKFQKIDAAGPAFKEAEASVADLTKKTHRRPGEDPGGRVPQRARQDHVEYCGMGRNAAGLKKALELIPALRERFWEDVLITGSPDSFNQELEKAHRLAIFWSSPSLWSGMPSCATNRAADTFARNTRRRKAKRKGTTRSSPSSPRGNSQGRTGRRSCTKNL